MRIALLFSTLISIALCACAFAQPAEPPTPEPAPSAPMTLEAALAHLDPLIGSWKGDGAMLGDPALQPTPITTRWTIARGFDNTFVRMEFLIEREGRPDSHWVGYFTYNPADAKYHTAWTWVSPERDYTFHETGTFDPAARKFTVTSFQRRDPTDERPSEVVSVFTMHSEDHFTVEDTTTDPKKSTERFVSLSCNLKRVMP